MDGQEIVTRFDVVTEATRERGIYSVAFLPKQISLDTAKRTVRHLISTDSVDRGYDVVDAEGWSLKHYQKNPVVFADHSYSIFSIIGRSIEQEATPKGLYSTTQFAETAIGESAMALVEQGMARAWSVGFAPLAKHMVEKGFAEDCPACVKAVKHYRRQTEKKDAFPWSIHSTKQELWEYSLVAVPANPDIVMNSLRSGAVACEALPYLFRYDIPADWSENQIEDALHVEQEQKQKQETPQDGSVEKTESTPTVPRLRVKRTWDGMSRLQEMRRELESYGRQQSLRRKIRESR